MLRIITENNIKTAVSVTPSDNDVLSEKATKKLFDKNIKGWVISESFEFSDIILDEDGNITSAVIKWPDGDIGSISNVVVGDHGITSVRYNRSDDGVYATTNISYSESGEVTAQEIVLTGF